MKVKLATEAAPGHADNEDFALHYGTLVGVFDGVTSPSEIDDGCRHGAAWYVRRLAARLTEAFDDNPAGPLPDLLAAAIDAVRHDHQGQCDLSNPATPAATVSLLRILGDRCDYLVLCDSFLIINQGTDVAVVTDQRFEQLVAPLRAEFLNGHSMTDSPQRRTSLAELTKRKQQFTNTADGYWIAAADPEAAHHAVTGTLPLSGPDALRRAALLTDGASRAVDTFALFDWHTMLDHLTSHGPVDLIRLVRQAERRDSRGFQRPRYKRHDDAAIAYCEFTQEGPGS